jgi:Tfp pilus assembly protein PilX
MKKNSFSYILTNDKGSVLAIALIIMVILSLIGVGAFIATNLETQVAKNEVTSKQTFQAAEAVSEYAISQLRSLLANSLSVSPTITTLLVPAIPGYTISTPQVIQGTPSETSITQGTYSGLNAQVSHYSLSTTATNSTTQTGTAIVRQLDDQLIPLFQFGVFYNKLLEIFPGATMTFNGRIHSNADIKLGTHATLTTNLKMTSGGTIAQPSPWHGENFSGTVTVSSQESGVLPLALPLPTDSDGNAIDPINLIQRGTESYKLEAKSGLKIINEKAYDKNGAELNLAASCGSNNPIETATSFTDKREGKTVSATQINLTKLKNCPTAYNALNDPPAGGDPGILYVSNTQEGTDLDAVRLTNGANLYDTTALPYGLTVATDNPLYIQGNYNTTVNPSHPSYPIPAAIAADAVTILSNSWSDTNSSLDLTTKRIASATTVNAAIMTGNVESTDQTDGDGYSGGLENFPRFLEHWTGKTFTYGGSMACLWESLRAKTAWEYGGQRYTAPTRSWSYNMDPMNMPPGTPRVRNLQRIQWYQAKS